MFTAWRSWARRHWPSSPRGHDGRPRLQTKTVDYRLGLSTKTPDSRLSTYHGTVTFPCRTAPSAIASFGDARSPSIDPVGRSSTRSVAVTLPVTAPEIEMRFATRLAVTSALAPMVRL